MISEADKDRVLDAIEVEEVVSHFYPGQLKKKGANLMMRCPFHNERTPSFSVSPSRGLYKCFSCGKSGNAISFLMDNQGMSFPEAVKWIADKKGIQLQNVDIQLSEEQAALHRKREAMFNANKAAAEFFEAEIKKDTPRAKFAREYVVKRFSDDVVNREGIGFAPGHNAFKNYAASLHINEELLLEIGLLHESESGVIRDAYFDRVMIPIRDRYNRVTGFTARAISDDGPKYVNSKESAVYEKSKLLFGIQTARIQAAKENKVYLVEGASDAMKINSIGIMNVMAPLGTALTETQLELIKKTAKNVCFIPDIDVPKGERFGAGINAVLKNGRKAFEYGLNVTVKEITDTKPGEKVDPGSYITNKQTLHSIEGTDFVKWYAQKRLLGVENTAEKSDTIKDIASMIAKCDDRIRRKIYAQDLATVTDTKASLWDQAINERVNSADKIQTKKAKPIMIDQAQYSKYGFYERDNCYFSFEDGKDKPWSNFTMLPLFHITDDVKPKRMFKITNTFGLSKIVEIDQVDLVSLKGFRVKIEGIGNFIWKGKEEQLTKLKEFLYECTESATEIKQLGWQRGGYYAFGNGVFFNNIWIPTDEYGIVRLEDQGNVYLPAASQIFADNKQLFQFERRFAHENLNNITLKDYCAQLIVVFGDNAKVGICFLLATLFLDVVKNVTKNFPILNLFGPKGSGKSELGHSLMSFFIADNTPPNLQNSTDAALAESVAKCANALVHLDEYKNTIELTRREFLKGIYDGTGRTRLNMDRDKKSETTAVDCGVIVSGQEMPTIDIALFSRMLYCSFDNTTFSRESKIQFNKLTEMRKLGCTHLTLQILKYRKKFEEEFPANYNIVMKELSSAMAQDTEERVYRNWIIPLAAFRTLMFALDLPFDYKDIFDVVLRFMSRQNKECGSNNEMSIFWESVDFLHQNGQILIDTDYKIKYEETFKGKGMKTAIRFKNPTRILYLCTKRIFPLYKQNAKNMGEVPLPDSSLRHYLEVSKEYLGIRTSIRFKNEGNSRDAVISTMNSGVKEVFASTRVDWALAFDYNAIIEKHGIHLDLDANDPDADTPDILEEDEHLPY